MDRYKHYGYSQSVMIPVSLEEQLMLGTLEFAIHTLVETRMDMSIFDERYHNDETGRWAYDPKILLKVVLLAYSRGLVSSRRIAIIEPVFANIRTHKRMDNECLYKGHHQTIYKD